MLNDEGMRRMIKDILTKAQNNREKQAYINPGEYGLDNNRDGMNLCRKHLESLPEVKSVEVAGHYLDVILK